MKLTREYRDGRYLLQDVVMTAKECSKRTGEIVRLVTLDVRTGKAYPFRAVVKKAKKGVWHLDFSDPSVWEKNERGGSYFGYYRITSGSRDWVPA